MKIDVGLKWIAIVASFSLLILPNLFPACTVTDPGKPMRCFFTYQAEFLLALLAVIIALSLFFNLHEEVKRFAGFLLFIIGIIILILPAPWAIGLCQHGDSVCHTTAAWTGGASIILALIGLIRAWRSSEQSNNKE